jgi:hypothetical protein
LWTRRSPILRIDHPHHSEKQFRIAILQAGLPRGSSSAILRAGAVPRVMTVTLVAVNGSPIDKRLLEEPVFAGTFPGDRPY